MYPQQHSIVVVNYYDTSLTDLSVVVADTSLHSSHAVCALCDTSLLSFKVMYHSDVSQLPAPICAYSRKILQFP